MKKILFLSITLSSLYFISCNNAGESPASIASKWCNLNAKIHQAENEEDKTKAERALDAFEQEMDNKYDREFIEKVQPEIEKCEEASEGRRR